MTRRIRTIGYRPLIDRNFEPSGPGPVLQSSPQHFVLCTSMPFKLIRLAFCARFALLVLPLFAHHSFSVEFDAKQRTTLQGVVTKVEWTNPHVYFYADVRDKKGQVENWAFEMAGPNMLARAGWDRNSLKVGDHGSLIQRAMAPKWRQPDQFCLRMAARCLPIFPLMVVPNPDSRGAQAR